MRVEVVGIGLDGLLKRHEGALLIGVDVGNTVFIMPFGFPLSLFDRLLADATGENREGNGHEHEGPPG